MLNPRIIALAALFIMLAAMGIFQRIDGTELDIGTTP